MSTEKRKDDHIEICLKKDVQFSRRYFDDIELIHNALPEIDKNKINIETEFLGIRLKAPLIIEAMTGGSERAEKINKNLAKAAQELGIGMGVGSQRAGLEKKSLEKTYQVRDVAPNIFLIGNIGLPQLSIENAKKCIEMIDADAIAIHLNSGQEAIQKEGDYDFSKGLEKIKKVCDGIDKPVIVKETGCGIDKNTAEKLKDAGISAIDVAGAGGTSWTKVESIRKNKNKIFDDWGIPTPASLVMVKDILPTISSGGIRTGVDIAKSIIMGAEISGAAFPFLKPATERYKQVIEKVEKMIEEMKITMFLTGSKDVNELKKKEIVIKGELKNWIN